MENQHTLLKKSTTKLYFTFKFEETNGQYGIKGENKFLPLSSTSGCSNLQICKRAVLLGKLVFLAFAMATLSIINDISLTCALINREWL